MYPIHQNQFHISTHHVHVLFGLYSYSYYIVLHVLTLSPIITEHIFRYLGHFAFENCSTNKFFAQCNL